MAAIKQLAAVTRSGTGKGAARSVRREGRVPAVIYGGGQKPEPISVDFKDVNRLIFAGHFLTSIFELEVGGRKERVLPRDYQLDVVTDWPVHVDFLRLTPGSMVRIGVPVHVANREASPGLKKGGAVNLVLHAVEVMAPADAIPEALTVDLTGLDFTNSVHVSDLKLPEGCRPVAAKTDLTVVTIVPPTVMAEEADRHGGCAGRRYARRRACRRRGRAGEGGTRQGRRSGQGRSRGRCGEEVSLAEPPPSAAEVRPWLQPARQARPGRSGAPCWSSPDSAIPARAMRATATTSASWRLRRSPARIAWGRSARASPGWRRKGRSPRGASCCSRRRRS